MATLWIHVWESASEVALGDPQQELTITIGGTSTQSSSAISGSNRVRRRCRLFADADCHVTWGENPTADTSDIPLGAENPEYFDIESGHLVAVITRA